MVSSRKLQYADRVALQQADQAIRKDVLRALVEIITNSNDSYSRLEQAGEPVRGEIVIEIQRKHKNSVLRVRDYAEGMTDARMDRVVGTYGEATSGLKEDKYVRGIWGRGLKDAIFGLGHGYVRSFRGDSFYSSSLLLKRGVPTFELEAPMFALSDLRTKHGIPEGNGTEVEIIVSRDDVKMPQFDNLRNYLQRHFELRPIMRNPTRRIILRNLSATNKVRYEYELTYKSPKGEKVLDEQIGVEGYPATAHLEVFRSNVQLSTRGEEGDYADGGLLVISKSTVLALTMLKFDEDPYASYFYGSIQCDYLHELLKNDEPVLTATRDGINWAHLFAKALKTAVENRIEPIVQAEREHALHDEETKLDTHLRRKLDEALQELNIIASSELSARRDVSDRRQVKKNDLPPSGIGFSPDRVYVQTGQFVTLTLRARLPEKAQPGSIATVLSDTSEVVVLTPEAVIEPREDTQAIGEARVKVEGRQVGSVGVITAYLNGHKALAFVQVRSKKETIETEPLRRPSGLFTDIRFDDRTDPRQRVYFDRVNSSIVVATAAPSVRIYLDKNNRLDTTRRGQVLLAELITEAVCREIAREGVERGNFPAAEGSEADAIQSHFIRLQNRYAHLIHEVIVKMD
jgi:Histidine kinase-, DNA gyrase B-, and HSP90-like ATPase